MRIHLKRPARRRVPAGWLVPAVAAAVLAGCAGPAGEPTSPDHGSAAPPASGPPATAPTPGGQAAPGGGAGEPAGAPPVATEPAPTEPDVLETGAEGPEVRRLQQRLVELGFWLGDPDGVYGTQTRHAVLAFQKANDLATDGIAGPRTRDTLDSAHRPTARSDQGRVIEVDLDRQLLLIAVDGQVQHVFDTSTGEVPGTTPPGRYEVFRHVDGYDPGPLGTLYRPKYFHQGVAIHGYPDVPPYPASHGCVRVTNAAMDWLWRTGNLPIGQTIQVY